jgi:uncharacterized protein YbaR (Trm112 family)
MLTQPRSGYACIHAKTSDSSPMIAAELLEILACPATRQPVRVADEALVRTANDAIAKACARTASGAVVREKIEGALIRQDGEVLYPIRDGIPIMLVEEGILSPARSA